MNKRKIHYFSGTSVYDNGVDAEKYFQRGKGITGICRTLKHLSGKQKRSPILSHTPYIHSLIHTLSLTLVLLYSHSHSPSLSPSPSPFPFPSRLPSTSTLAFNFTHSLFIRTHTHDISS